MLQSLRRIQERDILIKIQNLQRLHTEIRREINDAWDSAINNSAFIGGDEVQNFESEFASMHGFDDVVACANGTDALYVALKALALDPGAKVLVPSLTWISSSEAISQAGYRPKFVDVSEDGFNVNASTLDAAYDVDCKAVVLVHLYGLPCDMESIMRWCREKNLRVIEDCAQAHFAKSGGRYVGTFGDVATFSFYPGKNLGALGDAGALCPNNPDLRDFCRLYPRHGAFVKHEHVIEGINSRLDTLQAAMLRIKLTKINGWTERRREIANFYLKNIRNPLIELPKFSDNALPVWHLFTILTDEPERLRGYLQQRGIETLRNYPKPLPTLACYDHLAGVSKNFENARDKCARLLNIPMCPSLTDNEIETVVSFLNGYR